jgi:hypothetical protein
MCPLVLHPIAIWHGKKILLHELGRGFGSAISTWQSTQEGSVSKPSRSIRISPGELYPTIKTEKTGEASLLCIAVDQAPSWIVAILR